MKINTSEDLGFRELIRLAKFCEYMAEYKSENCLDVTFDYDLKYDEPCINFGFSTLYAIDFDLAFDNNINKWVEV